MSVIHRAYRRPLMRLTEARPGERLKGTIDRLGPASFALSAVTRQPGFLRLWKYLPDGQPLAVVDQGAQRPAFAGIVRQSRELPLGAFEQTVEGGHKRDLRPVELGALGHEGGIVMGEPDLVQPVDCRDAFEPAPAPSGQMGLACRAIVDVAPLMGPAPAQNDQPAQQPLQLLVDALAVTDDQPCRAQSRPTAAAPPRRFVRRRCGSRPSPR